MDLTIGICTFRLSACRTRRSAESFRADVFPVLIMPFHQNASEGDGLPLNLLSERGVPFNLRSDAWTERERERERDV
jgi:hypothetical protein